MSNKLISFQFLIFGLLLIAGGVMGYLKAQSIISLCLGSIFGLIQLISALFILKKRVYAVYTAFSTTLLLDLVFFVRYWKTEAFFPGAMSILTSLLLLSAYYTLKNQPLDTN